MTKKTRKLVIFLFLLCLLFSIKCLAEENISLNHRLQFPVGVGMTLGTPLGLLGIQAEVHMHPHWSGLIGVGSGIYFDTVALQARRFLLNSSFSPYVGLGIARWSQNGAPRMLSQTYYQAAVLGLVNREGEQIREKVYLLPLSLGVHFLSEKGLGIYGELNYLFSLSARVNGVPYGGLGTQFYF